MLYFLFVCLLALNPHPSPHCSVPSSNPSHFQGFNQNLPLPVSGRPLIRRWYYYHLYIIWFFLFNYKYYNNSLREIKIPGNLWSFPMYDYRLYFVMTQFVLFIFLRNVFSSSHTHNVTRIKLESVGLLKVNQNLSNFYDFTVVNTLT